jgi:hypothetical protein
MEHVSMTRWWTQEEKIERGRVFVDMHRAGVSVSHIARKFDQDAGRIVRAMRAVGYDPSIERHNREGHRTITPEGRAAWAAKGNISSFELIEQNSIPEPNSGCWLWTGACTGAGYGAIGIGGKWWLAHRLSYTTFHKTEIPARYIVRHTCDNPPCVNPDHLLLGTVKDNSEDAIKRDRNSHGIGIWTAKLSPKDIPAIRDRLAKGEVYTAIAADFGVSPSNIGIIKRSKSWRRVQ